MPSAVPNFTTALTGSPPDLERRIVDAMPAIEDWLRAQWRAHATPFYGSVDLRNSGFKLTTIDTNLYPGGFNNLNPDFNALCVQATIAAVKNNCPGARRLLLIPENHTRNMRYMDNVEALRLILCDAGMHVRIGSLDPNITAPTDIELPNGSNLRLDPLVRKANRVGVDGFDPCMVLLNNDLSSGLPEILRNLAQPVLPLLHAGWYMRRKSNHFAVYRDVAIELARLIGIDPWSIDPCFGSCGEINFHEHSGQDRLADVVSRVLADISVKYQEYGIKQEPFVVVKADSGTYGMAIMTIKDAAEVRNLNRKDRKKMEMGKGHMEVHEVLVQEGVYSFETINGAVAEPVVYMIDQFVVGAFYRVCAGRGHDQNLNVPGSQFVQLAFEQPADSLDRDNASCSPNRFYAYGVIARLALVAAAIELEQTQRAFADNTGIRSLISPH